MKPFTSTLSINNVKHWNQCYYPKVQEPLKDEATKWTTVKPLTKKSLWNETYEEYIIT